MNVMMSSLYKINRFLYELEYKDRLNIHNLTFEQLVEKLVPMNEQQRTDIINLLDTDTKNKIEEMKKGGLL